jgi:hypothetical protein
MVRKYDDYPAIPLVSFSIIESIDGSKEVVVRYPNDDEKPQWIATTHPDIVSFFSRYYSKIWLATDQKL